MEDRKYGWAIEADRNKHEYVIGIDFGHGETSAAYCPIGWDTPRGEMKDPIDLDFGSNKKVIPSAICITDEDKAYIGTDAFLSEVLKKSKVNVCFKQKPLDINGEKEKLMIRYMAEVYKMICAKNPALFTSGNHLVYIATPSGWDSTAKNLYGQMAQKAGIPIAGITSESRAAFVKAQQDVSSGLPQYIDKGAIVFDMGSSTLDFTYLQGDRVIDYGYDCGASFVEKSIYSDKRERNEDILLFEQRYPDLVARLLFEARCAKEEVYFHPDSRLKKTVNFEDIIDDEDLEDGKIKFVFQPGELNEFLKQKGYIGQIKQAMIDFKENHISNKPIYVAFLTGGASRMNFIKPLIEECWGLSEKQIYKDQDPSLTISRGVAELARADIRSGGIGNTKDLLDRLTGQSDVYNLFANSLIEKISSEVTETVAACITQFRDQAEDVSINDLEVYINENVENDMNNVCEWAEECYQNAFEQETVELRERLEKIVSNYSQQTITMQKGNVSLQSLPNLDMSIISEQMRTISSDLMDSGLMKDIAAGIGGAAVGGAIAMLLGGPLTWLIGGAAFLASVFFGDNESEEEKKQKARMKDLNKESRQKVFDHFSDNWDDITNQIFKSVQSSVMSNYHLRTTIEEQSEKIIIDYAKECLAQTRLMVE